MPDVDIILTIPPYELKTEDSRNVLPDQFSHMMHMRQLLVVQDPPY